MSNQTIISLAILKVNWDRRKKDYLENFVPFMAECLRTLEDDVVSTPQAHEQFHKLFGLKIPQNIIKTLNKRLWKQGYLFHENGVYTKNSEKLNKVEFQSIQVKVLEKHEKLIKNFIEFCSREFRINLTNEEAEDKLLAYLEEHQLILLRGNLFDNMMTVNLHSKDSMKYIIASFIRFLYENHAPDLDYIDTIVKGNMLANAIYLKDLNQVKRKFKKTSIYLDTTFTIFALGYAGEYRKEPCIELLELFYENGANLKCFRHTIQEIRGVLEACAYNIEKGGNVSNEIVGNPNVVHSILSGYSASDVRLFSAQLEKNIAGLRVHIEDKPDYRNQFVIDESGFSKELDTAINYHNKQALQKDIDSISAIMRLRKNKKYSYVEDCLALFITTNNSLAYISNRFLYKDDPSHPVPPCYTDHQITTMLWLKKPLSLPDLPKKRIIADCYAATSPDEKLWKLYLNEIDKLEKTGNYSEEDIYYLRHSIDASNLLMEFTLGEPESFTEGTISDILERIKESHQKDLKIELEKEKEKRKGVEKIAQDAIESQDEAWKTLNNREKEVDSKITNISNKFSSIISNVLKIFVILILILVFILDLHLDIGFLNTPVVRIISAFLIAAFLLLSIYHLYKGIAVKSLLRSFEIKISKFIYERLKKRF